MTPAQDRLAEQVATLLATRDDLAERAMFGARCFTVGGKIAVAVGPEADLLVRVPRDDVDALLARPGAVQAAMGERTMGRGWLQVDPAHAADPDERAFWVATALAHRDHGGD